MEPNELSRTEKALVIAAWIPVMVLGLFILFA
jgi:hypothetical protein